MSPLVFADFVDFGGFGGFGGLVGFGSFGVDNDASVVPPGPKSTIRKHTAGVFVTIVAHHRNGTEQSSSTMADRKSASS